MFIHRQKELNILKKGGNTLIYGKRRVGKTSLIKEHLKNIKIDEKVTKKKFLSIMEFEWIDFVLKNGNKWDVFIDLFGLYIKTPSQK